MKVKSLSVRLFATLRTVAYQAPPSIGFSRQECWSELPFPSPGDLPDPGIEPGSPSLFTFMHWRRKWQPTPVFLPRESQGWGSLVGCRLWRRTESDMTEQLSLHFTSVTEFSSLKETQVQFLGREDPLEKEMAIHPSILAWRIPWTEESGRLQSTGLQKVGHDRATSPSFFSA